MVASSHDAPWSAVTLEQECFQLSVELCIVDTVLIMIADWSTQPTNNAEAQVAEAVVHVTMHVLSVADGVDGDY